MIFISYSWADGAYNEKVLKLANRLIDNGFEVFFDKNRLQTEYSPQMKLMMHNGIVEADKVIVLLTETYKLKTTQTHTGVYFEFGLILDDIDYHRNKYIFASLDNLTNVRNIAPLAFQSRYIYDLSTEKSFSMLFDMLKGKHVYKVNDNKEKVDISQDYINEVYETFVSSPENSYFNFLGKAGEAYAAITRENVKLGNWNPHNGLDRFAIHCIAEAIKIKYDNIWTCYKTIDEVADDIETQIDVYLRWREKQ